MSLSQRALSALRNPEQASSALRAVVSFAAQNPGLDYNNYGEPSSYRSDARRITKSWHDVRTYASMCETFHVSDMDIIEASKRAFSGRLEITLSADGNHRINYCTGQYWPTEYRAAAAAVLERAAELAYQRAKAAA